VIPVTHPYFPPLEELHAALAEVWASGWLTNHGPKVQELERRLTDLFDAHVVVLANGTLALQLGIRAAGLRGRVATTPFSFVATTSALVWEGCEPVFVDVDPDTLNLSADALAAIDPRGVSGVLATHVYGNCCDVDAIGAVAGERGWPVLYDAAHAFGTTWRGRPAMACGDAATASFHATKVFHTAEGGAVITKNGELAERVRRLRSFGEREKGTFVEPGLNAKMSEVHAAIGLVMLARMDEILAERRRQAERYRARLAGAVRFVAPTEGCAPNHAYLPILCASETALLALEAALLAAGIQGRRYFHPSLSTLPWVKRTPTPVADDAARRVLCLPLFHGLADVDLDRICDVVARNSGGQP
jgi:dTDP-4-amino-4,6-dideoxygalactose transaminase